MTGLQLRGARQGERQSLVADGVVRRQSRPTWILVGSAGVSDLRLANESNKPSAV